MTVADQIIERVKTLSPQKQQELLRFVDQLAGHPEDDGLDAWVASAAKRAMSSWPKEDWSREDAEWEARQKQKDQPDAAG